MIIYKTTNLINGKIYIGQDSKNNPKYLGSGKIIKLAIKKYGKENFKKEILEYCDTFAELNDREIFWIFNLDSQNKKIGYNILSGQSPTEIILKLWADPNSYLNSPEYRKKLSDKMKLLWLDSSSIFNSDNFSKNISYTVKNLWNDSESTYNSSEYRKKLSDSQKNRIFSEFDIEQMRINIKKYINGENGYWYGKKQSKESNKKRSDKLKGSGNPNYGKLASLELRQKLSDSHKGQIPWNKDKNDVYSFDTLHKMSESAKHRNIIPENELIRRKKISEFNLKNKTQAKKIKDNRDGQIYDMVILFRKKYNLTEYMYKKLLKQKLIEFYED
jgi:hypothetical protein